MLRTGSLFWTCVLAAALAFGVAEAEIKKTFLIIIDFQKCFAGEGGLGGGDPAADHITNAIAGIRDLVNADDYKFDHIFVSQDTHPKNHISLLSSHKDAIGTKLDVHWPKCWKLEKRDKYINYDAVPFPTLPLYCTKGDEETHAGCCPQAVVNDISEERLLNPKNKKKFARLNGACKYCILHKEECRSTESIQPLFPNHCVGTPQTDSGRKDHKSKGYASKAFEDADFKGKLGETDPGSPDLHEGIKHILEGKDYTPVEKGTNTYVDMFSAFYDNVGFNKGTLDAEITAKAGEDVANEEIRVVIVGIAADFCVKQSAIDANTGVGMEYGQVVVYTPGVFGIARQLGGTGAELTDTNKELREEYQGISASQKGGYGKQKDVLFADTIEDLKKLSGLLDTNGDVNLEELFEDVRELEQMALQP